VGAVVCCKYKSAQPFIYGDSLDVFAPSKPKAEKVVRNLTTLALAKPSGVNVLAKLQAEMLAQVSRR
jgi:hypothetical protein